MSKINIEFSLCTGCGTCALRCPACFGLDENRRAVVRDEGARCISCGHCISLCPADAVVHRDVSVASEVPPLTSQSSIVLDELVRRRRSHRRFAPAPVSDETVSRLLDTVRFSPTGVNVQAVGVRVTRTAERIRALSEAAVGYFDTLIRSLDARAAAHVSAGEAVPDDIENGIRRNGRYRKMAAAFEKGHDPIFHKAPAVLFFHAPEDAPTPRDDCVIAAHTAVLAAESLGLGTCYIGLFNRACTSDNAVRDRLALPEGRRLFSTLILGYPAFVYRKVPSRKSLLTEWD